MQTMNLQCELGLPRPEELTPISQCLIPQELACAFNIPYASSTANGTGVAPVSSDVLNFSPTAFESILHMRSVLLPLSKLEQTEQTFKAEVDHPTLQGTPDIEVKGMIRVSNTDKESSDLNESVQVNQERETEFLIAGALSSTSPWHNYGNVVGHGVSPFSDRVSRSVASLQNHMAGLAMSISEVGSGNADREPGVAPEASSAMQLRLDSSEEVDSGSSIDPLQCSRVALPNEDHSARTLKKPRLVWTPQLHKRFVDAVDHLGIKNAVPKTIMQLMNVDGLKRENVASHLQKYRLYLKRMQGLSTEGPSSSDHLFASTPLPPSLAASAHFLVSHQNLNNSDHHPAGMPDMLGHGVYNLPPHLRSPTPSCSPKFDARAAFSSLSRPPLTTLMSPEQMREAYGQHSSSPHGGILMLFPTSGS